MIGQPQASAELRGPIEDRILRGNGRSGVDDAVVIGIGAERGPLGRKLLQARVLRRLLQRDADRFRLLRGRVMLDGRADIALCRCDIGVGRAVHQGIIAVFIRIDAGVERVIHDQQGVLRVKLCTHLADGVLRCLDGVGGRQAVRIGDDDGHDVLAVLQGPFAGLRAVVGHGVAVLIFCFTVWK